MSRGSRPSAASVTTRRSPAVRASTPAARSGGCLAEGRERRARLRSTRPSAPHGRRQLVGPAERGGVRRGHTEGGERPRVLEPGRATRRATRPPRAACRRRRSARRGRAARGRSPGGAPNAPANASSSSTHSERLVGRARRSRARGRAATATARRPGCARPGTGRRGRRRPPAPPRTAPARRAARAAHEPVAHAVGPVAGCRPEPSAPAPPRRGCPRASRDVGQERRAVRLRRRPVLVLDELLARALQEVLGLDEVAAAPSRRTRPTSGCRRSMNSDPRRSPSSIARAHDAGSSGSSVSVRTLLAEIVSRPLSSCHQLAAAQRGAGQRAAAGAAGAPP